MYHTKFEFKSRRNSGESSLQTVCVINVMLFLLEIISKAKNMNDFGLRLYIYMFMFLTNISSWVECSFSYKS